MFLQTCIFCVLFATVAASNDTLYVFAYSWTPEFCYGKPTYPGCNTPQYFWQKYLTIHGLWPQYTTSGYPSFCSVEPFDAATVEKKIGMDTLITFWPDVQYAETDPAYTQFWEHEWSKHGTCSGLSQTDYFAAAIDLLVHYPTPTLITENIGGNVSTADVRNAFGSVALQCVGGKYLSGAYKCFGRDAITAKPTLPIECPVDVLKEDTCSSSVIIIQLG